MPPHRKRSRNASPVAEADGAVPAKTRIDIHACAPVSVTAVATVSDALSELVEHGTKTSSETCTAGQIPGSMVAAIREQYDALPVVLVRPSQTGRSPLARHGLM